ncbi:MAG: ATP-binding protein [Bacteroidaceae bacterium]|nr:ATP-binding protein [Bacteroidaceae bacterium]
MEKQLTLQNKIEQISLLVDFVNQICEELHLDEALNFNLNLVLEEAVTNVIMYAYPQDEAHTLTLKAWTEEGGKLAFELCDQGKPFNPIEEAPEVDTTLSAEERQIGGLGIFLIKQMMDEVNYEYKDHSNVLTLKKNINS